MNFGLMCEPKKNYVEYLKWHIQTHTEDRERYIRGRAALLSQLDEYDKLIKETENELLKYQKELEEFNG
jgi:hypothetical protein